MYVTLLPTRRDSDEGSILSPLSVNLISSSSASSLLSFPHHFENVFCVKRFQYLCLATWKVDRWVDEWAEKSADGLLSFTEKSGIHTRPAVDLIKPLRS